MISSSHEPVMLGEVLDCLGLNAPLNTQTRIKLIDATLGAAGYTTEFCKKGAEVLALEVDPAMLKIAEENLKIVSRPSSRSMTRPSPDTNTVGRSFKLILGNFADIKNIATKENFNEVNGIVFDLGVSSQQLTSPSRGFSFRNREADLDMRVNPEIQSVRASDLLNALNVGALTSLFETVSESFEARKLAKRIVERRSIIHFKTVGDFLDVVNSTFKRTYGKADPATRPFMALRIAVNSELINLKTALLDSVSLLKPKGRLVVVSFHSGEDSIVKRMFLEFEEKGLGVVITKKALVPGDDEINRNARSRSAKLRVFEKK